ncbi:MAG: MBL fold metallo-hydrolase [Candidatus Thermoplasmatota archaeon]
MKVVPIAADSMGVRSMATYVQTEELNIMIDPSAALGPLRYGLPPTKQEWYALAHYKNAISKIAKKCDALIITHYHYDHYDPYEKFYESKTLFLKEIERNINASQKKRGREFLKSLPECEKIFCDGKEFKFGRTKIRFSKPYPHGEPTTRLGKIIMCTIEEKEKLLYTSDTQGPIDRDAMEYIIEEMPDILIIDGPPTIFLGWKLSRKNFEQSKKNLLEIVNNVNGKIILDHHLLRDLKYKELLKEVYESFKRSEILTMAEYLGKENNMLEAKRKELYGG